MSENKIRKLFAIKKVEDSEESGSFTSATRQKAPKIQRLITPERLRRKRILPVNCNLFSFFMNLTRVTEYKLN